MSYLPREDAAGTSGGAPRRLPEPNLWDRLRRPLGLTLLSTVLPGLGLVFTRRRPIGIMVLGLFLIAAVVSTWYVVSHGLLDAVASSISGGRLLAVMWTLIIGALIWIAAIVLTAVSTRPRPDSRSTTTTLGVFSLVMCLLVAIPAAWATTNIGITRDTTNAVFTHAYTGREQVRHGGSLPSPTSGRDPWAGTPRVNVLLIGSDAGRDRTGVRTDSMIVASINTKTGDTVLVSIPRNLEGVPFPRNNPLHKLFPNGYRCPDHSCLMNAIWNLADVDHRKLFPKDESNPGLDTTREVIEQIVGLKISDTVVIDLRGFEQLVNAMGGVYVTVPKTGDPRGLAIGGSESPNGSGGYTTTPGSIKGYIKSGYHKLDGYQALWYSRSRVQSDDYNRMSRQRCMVNAIVSQVNPATMFAHFAQIMSVAKKNITVDIPEGQLPAWVTLIQRAKKGTIRSVAIEPPTINTVDPNFPLIRTLVHKAITAPHVAKKKKTAKAPAHHRSSSSRPSATSSSSKPVSNLANGC